MIPIPATEQKLLEKSAANFSLLSPRVVEWTKNKRGEFSSSTEMMQILFKKSEISFSSKLLEKIQKKQKAYIDCLKEMSVASFEIKAKSSSPFITGLGSGHPTETGMILDRNTGLPYIPASSIKGVLRLACAINLAKNKYSDGNVPDDDEKLVRYFGSESDKNPKRGQLIILDAYSENVPKLKLDIMNPHFRNYYRGKDDNGKEHKQPVETESPNPIKFLTVKEETAFVFRCAFMPLENKIFSDEEIQRDVDEMFDTAFETVGFGGKTAIGYGRFKKIVTGVPTK
jgi:CRISPR-associated protein Cmr6